MTASRKQLTVASTISPMTATRSSKGAAADRSDRPASALPSKIRSI